MSARKVKTAIKKRTKLGLALEESAKEILAHARGEKTLPVRRVVLPDDVHVIRVRKETVVSQRVLHQSKDSSGVGARTEET